MSDCPTCKRVREEISNIKSDAKNRRDIYESGSRHYQEAAGVMAILDCVLDVLDEPARRRVQESLMSLPQSTDPFKLADDAEEQPGPAPGGGPGEEED